jgi:hypothetical protein
MVLVRCQRTLLAGVCPAVRWNAGGRLLPGHERGGAAGGPGGNSAGHAAQLRRAAGAGGLAAARYFKRRAISHSAGPSRGSVGTGKKGRKGYEGC